MRLGVRREAVRDALDAWAGRDCWLLEGDEAAAGFEDLEVLGPPEPNPIVGAFAKILGGRGPSGPVTGNPASFMTSPGVGTGEFPKKAPCK